MSHYVAGVPIPPEPNSTTSALTFEVYYARLGVATLPTVCDGDCGVDVMNMMLGLPQSFETRTQLRIDVSDYLFERMREPWMMELMAACQELRSSDVALYSFHTSPAGHAPTAPAPAVAAPLHAPEEQGDHVQADEETLKAMRWASKLGGDANVLALIRSLPTQIVKEQVALYRKQDETAVAEPQPPDAKTLPADVGGATLPQLLQEAWHYSRRVNALWANENAHPGQSRLDLEPKALSTETNSKLVRTVAAQPFESHRRSRGGTLCDSLGEESLEESSAQEYVFQETCPWRRCEIQSSLDPTRTL